MDRIRVWYTGLVKSNTKILDLVETWPAEDRAELAALARIIESRRTGIYQLSDDERFAVRKGKDEAKRGQFAPDDEIEEFYRLHRKI